MPTASYPARTRANARDSDATLWVGAKATLKACRPLCRSCHRVEAGLTRPTHVAEWIAENKNRGLNVAGNRESEAPGIGSRVERFQAEVSRRLRHEPVGAG
jgi:hypothetical protein